jgi:hypothetical protein
MDISVPYTEQSLTADEVERRLGLDERDPTIWLAEMYDKGFNMDVLEGKIIMGDEENENYIPIEEMLGHDNPDAGMEERERELAETIEENALVERVTSTLTTLEGLEGKDD